MINCQGNLCYNKKYYYEESIIYEP